MILVANASRDAATKFKVLRFTERLATPIRGVSLSSWFFPEPASNPKFFDGAGKPRGLNLEEM
jgi:hypothetical protein